MAPIRPIMAPARINPKIGQGLSAALRQPPKLNHDSTPVFQQDNQNLVKSNDVPLSTLFEETNNGSMTLLDKQMIV